ncbi:MAG: hypothetical protein P8Y80_05795 [Acidobacteriota bacterium]|jgi:uncharacterized membrane protein
MKSKASIVLLGIVIFLLGAIAGAVSHSLYQEYLKAAFFKASSQPVDIVAGLAKELELDAQQTESLRNIFDESIENSMALSQEIWPQYQTIYKETEQKIKDILREDQRARYEEFLRKFQVPPIPESQGK